MSPHNPTILQAVFKRRGAQTENSGIFDLFPDSVKSEFAAYLTDGESGVLCERSRNTWALLTDRRLLWDIGIGLRSFQLSQLADASADLMTSACLGARDKSQLCALLCTFFDGTCEELRLEPGHSFVGWWNVLKTVASQNQPRK
jgi:hypothetical protein